MFYNYICEYYILIMILSGFVMFFSMRVHFLLTLLSLEYLVLWGFVFMLMYIGMNYGDFYMLLLFLVFSVCEGVLGLSILVCMIRVHGNDYINSVFVMKW